MTLTEIQGNLFDAPRGWALVHCISADFALGAGVAKQIDDLYGMKQSLNALYDEFDFDIYGPCALPMLDVFNLVTKDRCWQKPRLEDLQRALEDLRRCVREHHLTKLAMPRIGCGLDRLSWEDVRPLIEKTFADTDVEIRVYAL